MAYGMNNAEALAVLNFRLRGDAYVNAPGGKIGLFTTAPAHGSAGVEVPAGVGYAQQAVAWTAATDPTVGATNSGALSFGPATTAWGDIVAWGRFDGNGVLRDAGAFDNTFTVGVGGTLPIAAGALVIALDGGL